jgi:hypothetical protein
MAEVLISTGPGTAPGVSSHLDAWCAWEKTPDQAIQVKLSLFGVVPNNDMNWNLEQSTGSRRMWFRDAGTQNQTGPKVLQLKPATGGGVQVVVKGTEEVQPPPTVTSWTVKAMPSTDVRALAATISQLFGGQQWFLRNPGLVADETDVTAATASPPWFLQPSTLAPANLSAFLETVIDGQSLTAGSAIVRMWNGIANTDWNASLAPTLLAWLYDFSNAYLQNLGSPFDQNSLRNILYAQLYNKTPAYKTYFDSCDPGHTPGERPTDFGTGDPPPANPPRPPGPHRHPRHK